MGHYLSEMPDGYRDMIARVGGGDRHVASLRAEIADIVEEVNRLRHTAEMAVQACLPILPLEGAWPDYHVSQRVSSQVRALPKEWAEAAQAIVDLGRAIGY